jgi:hypothetical protein
LALLDGRLRHIDTTKIITCVSAHGESKPKDIQLSSN